MPCVIAIVSGNENEPPKLRMDKFQVAALSALHANEPCSLEIGDQLTNLARHTGNIISLPAARPVRTRALPRRSRLLDWAEGRGEVSHSARGTPES